MWKEHQIYYCISEVGFKKTICFAYLTTYLMIKKCKRLKLEIIILTAKNKLQVTDEQSLILTPSSPVVEV